LLEWRNLICGLMIIVLPTSLVAQSSDRALLHTYGGTWLNKSPALPSTAIFPDDYIQTASDHTANIDAEGSSVSILPETSVQFEDNELVLDHGRLQINTARGMKVQVGCMTVIPMTLDRTQYDVMDVNGNVKVIAYKHDVKIRYRKASSGLFRAKEARFSEVIVREAEHASRNEHCGGIATPADAAPATGPILDSLWAEGVGIAAVGAILCFGLCHEDDALSPDKPQSTR
jgi:hypothetical protein